MEDWGIVVIYIGVVVALILLMFLLNYQSKKVSRDDSSSKTTNKKTVEDKPLTKGTLIILEDGKWASIVALVVIAIISIRLMFWLGIFGFGVVMFVLVFAAAVLLVWLYTYAIRVKGKKFYLSISSICILIVGIIGAGLWLYPSAPYLNNDDVINIANLNFSRLGLRAVSAKYQGQHMWHVKAISKDGWFYVIYDETTSEFKDVR